MSDSSADDAARKEQQREYNRQYREANAEKIKERKRQRYLANRERVSEYNRQYYAANREAVLAQARKYGTENADAIKARKRRDYAANPGKAKAYHAERSARGVYRLRHLEQTHGIDVSDWFELWDAQEGRCYLCGNDLDPAPRKTHVEHFHGCAAHGPVKSCRHCRRGLACSRCNRLIGMAGDDPEFLRKIADRLEAANRDVAERQLRAPQQLTLEF